MSDIWGLLQVGIGQYPLYYYVISIVVVFFLARLLFKSGVQQSDLHPPEPKSKRVLEIPPDPCRTFTKAQLKAYNGSNETSPIYISLKGIVYDVTAAEGFYGPEGAYHLFAGTDASRGLAKMDFKATESGWADLSYSELSTLDEWVEKFNFKYPVVGKLLDQASSSSPSGNDSSKN